MEWNGGRGRGRTACLLQRFAAARVHRHVGPGDQYELAVVDEGAVERQARGRGRGRACVWMCVCMCVQQDRDAAVAHRRVHPARLPPACNAQT
jgi:hypothetical protein